jgi:hypothetical protein
MTINVSGRVYGLLSTDTPRHQEIAVSPEGFILTQAATSSLGEVLNTQDLRFRSTAPIYIYAQRLTLRDALGVISYQYIDATGAVFVPTVAQLADLEPVSGERELELRVNTYKAKVASAGVAVGDIIQSVDRFDLLAGGAFIGTLWTNITQGTNGFAAPTLSNIEVQSEQVSRNVTESRERFVALVNDSVGPNAFVQGEYLDRVEVFFYLPNDTRQNVSTTWLKEDGTILAAAPLPAELQLLRGRSPDVVNQLIANRTGPSVPLFFRALNVGVGYIVSDRLALINFFDPSTQLRTITRAYNITNDPRMLSPLSVLPPNSDLGRDIDPSASVAALSRVDWQRNDPVVYYQLAITLPANTSVQILAAEPDRLMAGLQVVQQSNPSDVVLSYGSPVNVNLPSPNYRVTVGGNYGVLNISDENFTTASIYAWCAEPTILMLFEGTL